MSEFPNVPAAIFGAVAIFIILAIAVAWIVFPFMVNSKLNKTIAVLEDIRQASWANKPTLAPPPGKAVCPCNVCSKPIEFDRHRFPETANCPHCGLETRLYIPNQG